MRCEGYGSRRVCVSVCLSVKSHLTSGASFGPENAVTHSAGEKGQKICGVFSETSQLSRSSATSLGWPYIRSAILLRITRMRIVHKQALQGSVRDARAPCRKLFLRSIALR